MSASEGSRASKSGSAGAKSVSAWRERALKLRKLLSILAKRNARPHGTADAESALPAVHINNQTHLQTCCERALDAHTIEDAIFWHSEIINELSVEIYSIAAKPWSNTMKAQTAADLSELQSRHGAILHRLTGIVARNEQFVWQPQSLCKK